MRGHTLVALIITAGLWMPSAAQAATFAVDSTADTADPCGATCTLRGAIRAANATEEADVVLLPAGTFALTLEGPGEDAAATGDLDVTEPLTIRGAGADRTVVDGARLGLERMFQIHLAGAGEAVFEDLELTGSAEPTGPSVIAADTASLVLRRTDLVDNDGRWIIGAGSSAGGTVLIEGSRLLANTSNQGLIDAGPAGAGTLTIRDSTVSDNTVGFSNALIDHEPSGGAGTLTIERSVFERNETTGPKGGPGTGGVLVEFDPGGGGVASTLRVAGSRFVDNRMQVLAVRPARGDGLVERTEFTRNATDGDGAAVLFEPSADGLLTVRDSTFAANRAANGGAIAVASGGLAVANSTFSGNEAAAGEAAVAGEGGAIAVFDLDAPASLSHVTIAGNRIDGAGAGGGVFVAEGESLTAANSIVAGNAVGDSADDCGGAVLEQGRSLEGAETCGFEVRNADPKLGDLAGNGGPTPTRAIGTDSPAFDTADADVCEAADQRGVSRPQSVRCDIGAYELVPLPPPGQPAQQQAAPAPVAQGAVPRTTARRCVSRRRFRIRLRVPRGERAVKVVVRVNGKKVLVRRGRRLTSTVNLRGLPRGRFRVRITLTLASGKKVSGTRRYRTCAKPAGDGVPPKV